MKYAELIKSIFKSKPVLGFLAGIAVATGAGALNMAPAELQKIICDQKVSAEVPAAEIPPKAEGEKK